MSAFTPRVSESLGKSIDEAIFKGLSDMGVSIDEVDIEIVHQGVKGVLGIGSKPCVVRLIERDPGLLMQDVMPNIDSSDWSRDSGRPARQGDRRPRQPRQNAPQERPRRDAAMASARGETERTETILPEGNDFGKPQISRQGKAPDGGQRYGGKQRGGQREQGRHSSGTGERRREPVIRDDTVYTQYVKGETDSPPADFLSGMLELMGVRAQIYIGQGLDSLKIKIISESMGILIGHRGETLDALQYLTSLVVNRKKDNYLRISIDTENYRSKREETLARLARKIAGQVKASGQSVTLEPMNPYERRVLHASLQSNPYVTTCSEGEEPNRCVVVTPKK